MQKPIDIKSEFADIASLPVLSYDTGCRELRPASFKEIYSSSYLTKAQCLPFKSRFTQTVHTAQALYGKQLAVNIDKTGIDTILDKYLCYYPKQFRFLLKERIGTVLMGQQKKFFEK